MMNAKAVAALNTWVEDVRKRKFLVSVALRISGDKRILQLSGAMNRWLGEGDAQREKEAKLRRALGSFAHRLLSMAWNGWMLHHEQADEVRRRLIPFAARIRNRLAGLSFDGWVRYLDHRHARRDDSRAAAVHRARALAGKHLRAWHAQHDKFQRAARHMLYRELSRALASWRELAGRGSRKDALMRGALASMRCRELRAATNAWLALVERNRRTRAIVMRMAQRVLVLCFAAWAEEVETSKQQGAAAFSKAEQVARHFLNSAVSRAFHTLKEIVERRGALRAVLRRLKYPALTAAMRGWIEQNEACHERARKLRRAANFFVNGLLVLVYRGWARLIRRRANCHAATAEVVLARQGRLLRTWLEAVEQRNISELTAWAVRCLMGGKLGKAWRPWAKDARVRVAGRAALQRWAAGELGAAVAQWRAMVAQWRNARLGVLASGLHFEGAFTLKIFGAWRAQAQRQGVVRLLVGGQSRRSLLRRGWCAARDHAAMSRIARAGGLAAAGYSDAQLRRQALRRWHSAALASSTLQSMFHASASALLRAALRCWVRGGARYMAAERSAMHALAYWSGASRKSCWVRWARAASGKLAQTGKMHQVRLRVRVRVIG